MQISFSGDTAPVLGHVTSSYFSPILKRSIALAIVKAGLEKIGQDVTIPLAGDKQVNAKIANPVFYAPEGVRQNVE